MNTQVITIKVDAQTKKQAQSIAKEMGLSLSAIIKGFLRRFVGERNFTFSVRGEEPSEYLINAIKQARKNRKKGEHSPVFDNAKDAIAWLHRNAE